MGQQGGTAYTRRARRQASTHPPKRCYHKPSPAQATKSCTAPGHTDDTPSSCTSPHKRMQTGTNCDTNSWRCGHIVHAGLTGEDRRYERLSHTFIVCRANASIEAGSASCRMHHAVSAQARRRPRHQSCNKLQWTRTKRACSSITHGNALRLRKVCIATQARLHGRQGCMGGKAAWEARLHVMNE